jgi:GNAT superfamily N-acetyltransferase
MTAIDLRWTIDEPRADEYPAWRALFAEYALSQRITMNDKAFERVWGWILDPQHPVSCLVIRDRDNTPVALAHYREFPCPLGASVGCFLDDLYVTPAVRGNGIAGLLLDALTVLARERGWHVVRWFADTANAPARRVYAHRARAMPWITYDRIP